MMQRIVSGKALVLLVGIALLSIFGTACGVLKGPSVVPEKREYTADFDAKQGDWDILGSGYAFADGDLVITSGAGDAFLKGDPWSNYEIESELTVTAFPTYAIVRYLINWDPNTTSGYAVSVAEGGIVLHQYDQGSARTVAANTDVRPVLNERFSIKIRVNDGVITVYGGTAELFSVSGATAYPQGRVGIKASNAVSARIHSYRIREF